MRWLLRRLLWLGPALLLVTVAAFAALALALPAAPDESELPLFFNPEPGGVERRAALALRAIVQPNGGEESARRELARLGGAALPFILPALDSLTPEGRARAVEALRPVGARMGFEIDEGWERSREVLFWIRFWEEHSIDYRPSVARRAVLRLAQKSTLLRDTEVRQLDTYALPELIEQMPPVKTENDVDRVRRLSQLAFDLTDGAVRSLRDGADADEARRVAAAWTDWWTLHHSEFVTYDGTERLLAMLRDTRYGAWLAQASRHQLGLVAGGGTAWDALCGGARISLPLFATGLLSAWAWAWTRVLTERHGSRRYARLVRGVALLRAAAPVLVLALLLRMLLGEHAQSAWIGVLLMAMTSVPLASLYHGAATDAATADFVRTLDAFGVSRWRACLATLKLSSASLVVQTSAHVSSLLTLTFVLEYALGLPGLGPRTIAALREPDLNWLMAIILCSALLLSLLQALSELALMWLDPRQRGALHGSLEGSR